MATASASDTDVGGNHAGQTLYQPYQVFDDITSTEWLGKANRYDANGDHTGGETTTENSNNWTGDWLQIQTPNKIRLTSTKIARQLSDGYGTNRSPRQGAILGSNNSTTWQYIHNWSGIGASDWPSGGVHREFTFTTPSDAYYKYYRFIIEKTQTDVYASIGSWQLLGTEEATPVPIQIGGGNIDKVANFRVYDKFVGEDQALEIWDAQKDHFGRAKSSMTLYKGRLGLGTTEPEGRLAVADEPHAPEEFPPRAMTGYKNYFEGHGEFCVSASSVYNTTSYYPYAVFDRLIYTGGSSWNTIAWNSISPSYNTSTKLVSSGASLGSYVGEWLKLSLPYGVKLAGYQIAIRSGWSAYGPADWVIIGSNDDKNWHLVTSVTAGNIAPGSSADAAVSKDFIVETTKHYKHLALVCSKVAGGVNQVNIAEIKYFGTREQGQSVLHDGQLTLTKNLNVPRIGPALDADDTPRRDRLVVEYNTSTNPTFEGAVRDTSGRGNDGVFYGGASYSAADKAFSLDGTDDYVQTESPSPLSQIHSMSAWIKMGSQTSINSIMHIGTFGTSTESRIFINGNVLHATIFGSTIAANSNGLSPGRWYHIVYTFMGGTFNTTNVKLFIDGTSVVLTQTQTAATSALTGKTITIGSVSTGGEYFKGDISNPQLYDTALTASEVKTLYDMGRCDEGHHVVNFSKTRVGIGLGDGEAPQAALDVRGDIAGPFHTFLTGDNTTTSSSPTSSAHSALVSHTFDVPKEYNSYGTTNLEVFGQVKWSGECPDPWNTNLSLRLYYGSGLTSYIGSAQVSGGSNSKGCGMIAISNATDNGSTLDSAIASSRFLIPNCSVGPGSQLKLELLHSQGAGSGTVYTNRTTGATTTDYNYERGTTNFFMALKVV